ncbi:ROK family protein, partial [Acinetobacter baumannii]|nr:ROK family protein [Acinetobacter baumannii]
DRKRLLYGDVINFNGGEIARFADVLRFPCRPSNDSTAAGIAEFAARPKLRDAVYLYLSNSVGGSVMLGGSVYEGVNGKSAEFG